MSEPMECPNCKEISFFHVDTEYFDDYLTLEYECEECHHFAFYDERIPDEIE